MNICSCGYECDRDIHAARNVKYIGVVKRNECLEQASAETLPSGFVKHFSKTKTSQRSENEDSNLYVGTSSLNLDHML